MAFRDIVLVYYLEILSYVFTNEMLAVAFNITPFVAQVAVLAGNLPIRFTVSVRGCSADFLPQLVEIRKMIGSCGRLALSKPIDPTTASYVIQPCGV
jgi:hypothetical protein